MKNLKKQEQFVATEVVSVEKLGLNSYWMTVNRPFDFVPGQVVKLTTNNTISPRLYSIASGTNDKHLSFLFDLKAEGELTPLLANLNQGQTILVSQPFGEFVCKEEQAVWVASGTGIAPYLSMIRSGMVAGKTLIHGVRYSENFFFRGEMESLLDLNYIKCCSGNADKDMFHGRVTEYLQKNTSIPLNRKYYLCGNPEMVVDTREVLLAKGVAYENILAEIYF